MKKKSLITMVFAAVLVSSCTMINKEKSEKPRLIQKESYQVYKEKIMYVSSNEAFTGYVMSQQLPHR